MHPPPNMPLHRSTESARVGVHVGVVLHREQLPLFHRHSLTHAAAAALEYRHKHSGVVSKGIAEQTM